ncbi:MAG: hypothetical protein IKS51_00345 [Erysipelotrichaceae bacterium]|nr:hypothetical protein [Erysipelotrichaceae bacterium]
MKNKKEYSSSDNWYAEEKERESRISAWDFDEGKNLREQHEKNCDAKGLALEHRTEHQNRSKKRQRSNGTSDPFFVIDLILFSLMIPFSTAIPNHSLLPITVMFLLLSMGIIFWESLFKKFPPTWYFLLALILTVIMEILALKEAF